MWSMTILCLTAVAFVGFVLAGRMRRRGQQPTTYVAVAALCLVNPFTWDAIRLGHPDELLAGALCVGAVLAALRGWRVHLFAIAGLGFLFTVPVARGDFASFEPLVVLLAVPLTALWWMSRRRTPDDVLALLALLFLLRGLLDPVNDGYVFAPFLLSLVAWEGLTRRGLPVVSLLSCVAIYFTPHLLAAIPVGTWIALRLYAPALKWRRRAWPLPMPREPATR
jgi:hypothetical protein